MKRPINIYISILFCLYLTGLTQNSSLAEHKPYAQIFSLKGDVWVRSPDSIAWGKAQEDIPLYAGWSLQTGSGSEAELAFDEDKITSVRENSNLVMLFEGSQKMELIDGSVYASVKNLPAGSAFEIKTPSAVCGARGTDWLTTVKDLETSVESYEDSPYITGLSKDGKLSGETVNIPQGFGIRIQRLKRLQAPVKLDKTSIEQWRKWKKAMEPKLKAARLRAKVRNWKLGGDRYNLPPKDQVSDKASKILPENLKKRSRLKEMRVQSRPLKPAKEKDSKDTTKKSDTDK